MKNSITVAISLPIILFKKIESIRDDIPRSLLYRRLIEKSLGESND